MAARLVDYSYAHPRPTDIRAGGYLGAMRYLSYDGPPKNLTLAERDALHGENLGVGLVWEAVANAPLMGWDRGISDAAEAMSQADALSFPLDLPVFFAVDFEPFAAHMQAVSAYFRALNLACTRPVGAYGCYALVESMHGLSLATYFWQCVAWSYGQVSRHAHLFQRFGYVLGDTCDANDILRRPDWLWLPTGSTVLDTLDSTEWGGQEEDDMPLNADTRAAFETLARDTLAAVVDASHKTADEVVEKLDSRDNATAVLAATAVIGHIDAQDYPAARQVALDLVTRLTPPGQPVPT